MAEKTSKRVAVIGGGLVGGVAACLMGQRGFQVDVYENRSDIRLMQVVRGRSINLALSKRGRDALSAVGLEEKVVNSGMPMYARMIHDLNGNKRRIPYGKEDQCIISIDRRKLNEVLLDAAEQQSNVKIHFSHKLLSCDFDTGKISLQKECGEVVQTDTDLILGCDGAFSAVRRQMAKSIRFDFSQEYIPHGYMELCIPADANGKFAMEEDCLHIWPRNEFMMIALPNNADNSFVVTLFMPFVMFEKLTTKEAVLSFFEDTFPDSIPLIGRQALVDTVLSSKALPMVMTKCWPYNVGQRSLIMGDAAHAMVPFYGQGMNCGLEDALIFDGLLGKYGCDLPKAVPSFTEIRNEDCKAICDLAMYNYIEMRQSVNSKLFLLRKQIDNFLHWLLPATWIPLYTMVSFTRIRYSDCIRRRQWQDKILNRLMSATLVLSVMGGGIYALRMDRFHGTTFAAAMSTTISKWSKQLPILWK